MNIYLFIHYLITFFFLLLPFLSLDLLIKYKLYLIPFIMCIYWLIYDGCHLSDFHSIKKSYISDLVYNLTNISINKVQETRIILLVVCSIPTIILVRLLIK